MTELQHIAAKLAFNRVIAEEIQDCVDRLLEQGTWSDGFVDILDSRPATLREVLPPFAAYLHSIGIPLPSKEEAVWQLIGHHVAPIAAGRIEPLKGLERLIAEVYWDYHFGPKTTQWLGDSHGIHKLIAMYWQQDEMGSTYGRVPAWDALRTDIVKASREWMHRYVHRSLEKSPTLEGSAGHG